MANLTNKVDRLDWQVPIADSDGKPTPEFQRKWVQQARTNATIPDLTTAAKVSGVLDLISATPGSLLARGASAWGALAIGGANTILKSDGNDPSWSSLSGLLDTLGNTQGNVLYRNGANWTALAPGTAGQVLTTGGAGANPAWAAAGGSGGGAASAQDNGTTFFLALSDADGQLVLDGSGNPVFAAEVLPAAALPLGSDTAFGAFKVDNISIAAVAGLLSTKMYGMVYTNVADIAVADGIITKITLTSSVIDTTGGAYASGKFTPTKAGKYLCFITSIAQVATTMSQHAVWVAKNGTIGGGGVIQAVSSAGPAAFNPQRSNSAVALGVASLNGTTDWVEFDAYVGGTGGSDLVVGSSNTFFGVIYLGA